MREDRDDMYVVYNSFIIMMNQIVRSAHNSGLARPCKGRVREINPP